MIKYRVYDKVNKEFMFDGDTYILCEGELLISGFFMLNKGDAERYLIQQYIGLNTILGKLEIYVGDLLKDEEGFIWEALPLSDGMFKIYCSDLNAIESAYPRAVGCELIGNINEKDKLSHEDFLKI